MTTISLSITALEKSLQLNKTPRIHSVQSFSKIVTKVVFITYQSLVVVVSFIGLNSLMVLSYCENSYFCQFSLKNDSVTHVTITGVNHAVVTQV